MRPCCTSPLRRLLSEPNGVDVDPAEPGGALLFTVPLSGVASQGGGQRVPPPFSAPRPSAVCLSHAKVVCFPLKVAG